MCLYGFSNLITSIKEKGNRNAGAEASITPSAWDQAASV